MKRKTLFRMIDGGCQGQFDLRLPLTSDCGVILFKAISLVTVKLIGTESWDIVLPVLLGVTSFYRYSFSPGEIAGTIGSQQTRGKQRNP